VFSNPPAFGFPPLRKGGLRGVSFFPPQFLSLLPFNVITVFVLENIYPRLSVTEVILSVVLLGSRRSVTATRKVCNKIVNAFNEVVDLGILHTAIIPDTNRDGYNFFSHHRVALLPTDSYLFLFVNKFVTTRARISLSVGLLSAIRSVMATSAFSAMRLVPSPR
jgi:hypothetical protein